MALQPGQHDPVAFQIELGHARRVDQLLQAMPYRDTTEGWRLRRLVAGTLSDRQGVRKVQLHRRQSENPDG
jgi:hypothetical protein